MIYLTGTPRQIVTELYKYGVYAIPEDSDYMLELLAKTAWPHSWQLNLSSVHGDVLGTYGYAQSWTLSIDNPKTGESVGAVSGYSIGEVASRLLLKHYEATHD